MSAQAITVDDYTKDIRWAQSPVAPSRTVASKQIELVCVPPQFAGQIWPQVEHHIRRAMQRGGMGDYATVARGVLNGPDLLWVATDGSSIDACAITSLSLDKVCTIVACGGNKLGRFVHLIDGLEQFAKAEGCKAVRICGRPGWLRRLSGYQTKKVIIEKEV